MGIKNIENRMNLYGDLLKQNIYVEFVDKVGADNQPTGTKVIVKLPYKLKNDET